MRLSQAKQIPVQPVSIPNSDAGNAIDNHITENGESVTKKLGDIEATKTKKSMSVKWNKCYGLQNGLLHHIETIHKIEKSLECDTVSPKDCNLLSHTRHLACLNCDESTIVDLYVCLYVVTHTRFLFLQNFLQTLMHYVIIIGGSTAIRCPFFANNVR